MTAKRSSDHSFAIFALCFLGVLLLLFYRSFDPNEVLFSNDGPLGAMSQKAVQMPSALTGVWYDLNTIGNSGGTFLPDLSQGLFWLLGPLYLAKFYAMFGVLVLGLCAWFFFRQSGLVTPACVLGGLAAALNSGFFSAACWGVPAQPITVGMAFLAMGLLANPASPRPWVRVALAGLAVGMGVEEGADVGALFSVFVAAFVMYQALAADGSPVKNLAIGAGRVVAVAVFAAFIAAQALSVLISTSIQGVAGTQQDVQTKAYRWDYATQWSLPKRETLSIIMPGLFGYRMDTTGGGNYWGAMGRDPAWDRYFAGGPLRVGNPLKVSFPGAPNSDTTQQIRGDGKITLPGLGDVQAAGLMSNQLEQTIAKSFPQAAAKGVSVALTPPPGSLRFSGGAAYSGVLVVLLALWTTLQCFRKQSSVFPLTQRKALWFWVGTVAICLPLAWGRFAPFYQWFYALPYVSTIRNPAKFEAMVIFALVVLFAYGVDALWRKYMESAAVSTVGLTARLKTWWARAALFDRRWVIGCAVVLGATLVAWMIYASSRDRFVAYLTQMNGLEGRGPEEAAALAQAISTFSIAQVGWFVLFFVVGAASLVLILSGSFAGRRAKAGAIVLGLLLVVDLVRANQPWIVYWNYQHKYATNPIIERLRERPYEYRVSLLPSGSVLDQLYKIEWTQHLFYYYNIQSLDIVQMPRMPEDWIAFETALHVDGPTNAFRVARRWQLTNTRYLLGATSFLAGLNQQLDPLQRRFRIAATFDIVPKPDVANPTHYEDLTAVEKPDSQYALFEFTGSLPRASLYANWQVRTNDQAALATLGSPDFDPARTVLVANPLPAPGPTTATNQTDGSVEFASYAPAHLVLKTKADFPAVLLLNDKFDRDWHVAVDGEPATLLRCNYIMQGVHLPAGLHTVELQFRPPIRPLYISVAAMFTGVSLVAFLVVSSRRDAPKTGASPPESSRPGPERRPLATTRPAATAPQQSRPRGQSRNRAPSSHP